MKNIHIYNYLGWKFEYELDLKGDMTIIVRKVEGNNTKYIAHTISETFYNLNKKKAVKMAIESLKQRIENEEDELKVLLHKTMEKNGRN